jgi:transcriptional regulator with XRE-family HTH domain
MNDTVIYFGDGVKALDDSGTVGGYLVRFSEPVKPQRDLSGEFFTAKTYLGPKEGDGAEAIFDHGIPVKSSLAEFADHTFAPLKTRRDKIGLWAETVLNLANEYEKAVFELVKKNKLGWSSGAAGHRVKKSPNGEITHWPIAEGSLTPRPCEPLNRAIPVKSISSVAYVSLTDDDEVTPAPVLGPLPARLNKYVDDITDSGKERKALVALMAKESGMSVKAVEEVLAGTLKPTEAKIKGFARALDVDEETLRASSSFSAKTIKGMFEEELAEKTPSVWELWNAYCSVTQKLAMATASNKAAGVDFDLDSKLSEATAEYVDRLKSQVVSQIESFVDEGKFDEPFYLKAIIELSEGDLLSAKHLDIEQHSDLVVSAMKEITARYRANHEARRNQKAGRVLSQRNRTRLMTMLEQIKAAVTDCQVMLDESQPMASDEAKRAAKAKLLRSKWNAKKSGVK